MTMNKSNYTNSELSGSSSDVSLQLEDENTIEDSFLTSDEDTSFDETHKSQSKKKKPPILDSTGELDDSSVLDVPGNDSEVIDTTFSSIQEELDQKNSEGASFQNSSKKYSTNQNAESDSDYEKSFRIARINRNHRIISSDSSDTEEESYKQRSPSKKYSNHDSNISKDAKRSQVISSDDKYDNSDIDRTVDLGIERAIVNKQVSPKQSTSKQYIRVRSTEDLICKKSQPSPCSSPATATTSNLDMIANRNMRTATDQTKLNEEVANISLELRKSRISGKTNDTTNIIESGSSESEQPVEKPRLGLRLTEEFRFGKGQNILHSTLLEPHGSASTPVNKNTGKRLLNKSIDTPRTIKQIKESDTPRNVPQINSSSSDTDVEFCNNDDDDIIDVSSEEEASIKNPVKNKLKQTKLDDLIIKKKPVMEEPKKETESLIEVTKTEYDQQTAKIKGIEGELLKARNLMRVVNLEHLPDKGESVRLRYKSFEARLVEEVKKLSKMKVTKEESPRDRFPDAHPQGKMKVLSWEELEAKAGVVQPKTFGKQAMSTYNAQKAVTMDRLQQLHGSLKTCPSENDYAEDPKGLKVELMQHQRRALAWLMWRELQKPSGGILADDMGLGKTLTMIALMLKTNETEKNRDSSSDEENSPTKKKQKKHDGGMLVVCPASLINQWTAELERRTKRGLASSEMYHGPKRETNPRKLAQHDMVVTTYAIVNNELEKNGAIFRVKWRRIVIDEAHQIRNHKSQTSEAVCKLSAKSRWALTGTPVHNKELDMYALLKFLRCTPFDDLAVWKRWVGDKSTGGTERLHTVISSLMLRRTKLELIEKGSLNAMPERKWELIPVELSKRERDVYSKILIFSRTLFAQFLHQRAEKNQDVFLAQYDNTAQQPNGQNQEYVKMREKLLKLNKLKDIKQHEILVLLLRLRQICCHPSLIISMLPQDMDIMGEDDSGDQGEALDLLEQLNKLTLDGDVNQSNAGKGFEEALGLKEAARGVLNPSDPIFSETTISSKIKELIKVLRRNVLTKDDKAIIVSQWPTFLRLISRHLKEEGIVFDQLDGSVPVNKRMNMVDRFNDPEDKMRVLLLSLTAGGVGLNLIGANHLFLLDLHWNPQLENQAQDRIYRLGQKKSVNVYKFMATDTIEKRILDLQEKKLGIAQAMLTGTKQAITSKLTLQDLKMLFEM